MYVRGTDTDYIAATPRYRGLTTQASYSPVENISFLDVIQLSDDAHSMALEGLRIVVIGGGPAGLAFATAASAHGAEITVLEKAGDPRSDDPGYSDRSFNVTLDKVGRYVLGNAKAWNGGIQIVGRAIQNFKGTDNIYYAKYGTSPEAVLISIPCPILRQNLVDMAVGNGAEIRFHARAIELDPDDGTVWFIDRDAKTHTLSTDLIVITDGLHSLSEKLLRPAQGMDYYLKSDSRSCVNAMLYPEDGCQLSLHHIHFWHELAADSCTIGIPNLDGSVAIFLISNFDDINPEEHPFATPELAMARLQRDFPQLLAYPQLAFQLPNRRRQHFHYKSVASYKVGQRAVIAGDAGCTVPPWAGFGANSALYSGASLAYQLLNARGDIDKALDIYSTQQSILSRIKVDFVKDLGSFLSGPVAQSPEDFSDPALAPLIKQAQEAAAVMRATQKSSSVLH